MVRVEQEDAGKRVVLVAGIPGTGVPEASDAFLRWVSEYPPAKGTTWGQTRKFEDLLVEEYNARNVDKPIRNIVTLLQEPKLILRDLWNAALDRLKTQIDESRADRVLVPIHLVWYHSSLREHISVLDFRQIVETLNPHKVEHVLCLIDDIHDIYARLRGPGRLYDRQAEKLSASDSKRGHALRRHLRLLDWRSREIMTAESLAHSLGCRGSVLATKHDPKTLYQVLKPDDQVYFSHPISEVRDLEVSGIDSASALAAEIKGSMWEVQRDLAESIALLQPTTIDEYRISSTSSSLSLSERFYPRDAYVDTLFVEEGCQADNVIYDDLRLEEADFDEIEIEIARDLSETVQSFIENQVTARDLQLVSQSTHLIVYRPRFNGHLSNGVQREILYHDSLAKHPDSLQERGKVILLDTLFDEDRFSCRQFIEHMIGLSLRKEWDVQLGETDIYSYLADMNEAVKASIEAAAEEDSPDRVREAIDLTLEAIGRPTDWSLGTAGQTRPLSEEHTFHRTYQSMEDFLQAFLVRLKPFSERPPYAGKETKLIDEMNSRDLRDWIVSKLQAEED